MYLDILKLQNYSEDNTLRRCIRAYTVIPKYCSNPNYRNNAAVKIVEKLQEIDKKQKLKYGVGWRKNWEEKIKFKNKNNKLFQVFHKQPCPFNRKKQTR